MRPAAHRCLACGFVQETTNDKLHCSHCFADRNYLRPMGGRQDWHQAPKAAAS